MRWKLAFALLLLGCVTGCPSDSSKQKPADGTTKTDGPPAVFSLAWSEYPSWSVFGVAAEKGLIDGEEGKQGSMETKWNVDIVLKQADYDPCIQFYGSSTVDAVCITNMDALAPATTRPGVAILPTSTSVGADACIAVGVDSLDQLAGVETYGLERSVSQYCFERVLELKGKKPADFPFKNMDPAAAAQAMQTNNESIKSIMVWNPFVMQTLRTRSGSKVLLDSSEIKEEIIDMVVVAKDSLAKPGGKNFAYAVIDTYYELNKMLADPKEGDSTLEMVGKKFSNLGLEDMKTVVQQTQFYKTPTEALALMNGDKFQKETMPAVVAFCTSHGITEKAPVIGFGQADAQLNFDSQFLQAILDGKASPE